MSLGGADLFSYLKEMWELASQGNLKGIWFWVCVYAFIACGYSIIYQIRVRRWPVTIGTLSRATVSEFGMPEHEPSEQDYYLDARYTYTIQVQEYSGRRVSPWIMLVTKNLRVLLNRQLKRIESSHNGQVKVFYNPKKPTKSYLVLPGRAGLGFTFLLGILPAIGFLFRYYH